MISKKLRELRHSKNVTQKQIAQILDITVTAYASYEQSISEPNIVSLKKLADYYECSIDYLLGRENEDSIIVIKSDAKIEESKDYRINEINAMYKNLSMPYQAKLHSYAKLLTELHEQENVKKIN